jgi:hypothetical protein
MWIGCCSGSLGRPYEMAAINNLRCQYKYKHILILIHSLNSKKYYITLFKEYDFCLLQLCVRTHISNNNLLTNYLLIYTAFKCAKQFSMPIIFNPYKSIDLDRSDQIP